MKIGIDYSLSSPGVCVNTSKGEFKYEDCSFYFLTGTKKYDNTFKDNDVRYTGTGHKLYTSEPERYNNIADWVIDIIKSYKGTPTIQIENYSYGSTGRVFHIAENLGLLKYKLKIECGWDYNLLPPSVIKKFGTDKGNANKELMLEAFEKDTGANLPKIFDTTSKSPISDVADAYFICKYTEE